MELNIKFDEKMMVKTANRVLDEYEYNGKTIREWADLIANPKTNADRIRSMTDEELAQYMGDVQTWGGCPNHGARNCTENCADCWLDWLKQEVTTNSTT